MERLLHMINVDSWLRENGVSKTCHPWKFPGGGSNCGSVTYMASWPAGHLLPNDDALGVPFGGWCWKGGGCIVQFFFFVRKKDVSFFIQTRIFCQNMHLSFSLLEGPNLTIPIEMLKNAFFRPPLLKESLGILQVSHLRTQTLGVGPRWVFWKKQREPKLLRVV